MSTRAVILLLLGCLLFALAGGFVARQISLTRFAAEERANLEAQALSPARPTPTRVLSAEERVPTWTPTPTVTPTYTPTVTPNRDLYAHGYGYAAAYRCAAFCGYGNWSQF